MTLSIIIVNYRTPQLLKDCLRSIYSQPRSISFELIVIDNDSGDNSRELILQQYPDVKWIQLDYNAGFARANNAGIKEAQGDIVLLLNSDTVVIDSAISECFHRFSASPYVACGVQLLNRDGSNQISGNYFMKGGLNNLLPVPVIGPFLKWLGDLLRVSKPHLAEAHECNEVDWINGAFLMVKKAAIQKAGLLDEDFFLYAEEAEWCYRLGRTGKLAIFGDLKILHLQGESSKSAFNSLSEGYYNLYDRKGLQIMLSNFVRIRKQFGIFWFYFHLLVYTVAIPVFFILQLIKAFRNHRSAMDLANGYTKNVFTLWKFAIRISSNKPYFYKVL